MTTAKKSLGQNFLKSTTALKAIVNAGSLSEKEIVLEIGPGRGALTEYILKTGVHVVAVEKDRELISVLEEKFAKEIASKQLRLIEKDILDFNPKDFGLKKHEYKIIANIPYYITGAIFEKFLEGTDIPKLMVVLVQKEVAQRITARDGKESILSMSVKVFGKPKIVMKVPNTSFSPAPKVDSAVLLVDDISHDAFIDTVMGEKFASSKFFTLLKAGFAHKRKLLIRNLEKVATKDTIEQAFTVIGIPKNIRAESLTKETWLSLTKYVVTKP